MKITKYYDEKLKLSPIRYSIYVYFLRDNRVCGLNEPVWQQRIPFLVNFDGLK